MTRKKKTVAATKQTLPSKAEQAVAVEEMRAVRERIEGIHIPAVRVLVRSTDDQMTSNDGGEYFETCYEIRSEDKRSFQAQLETVAKALGGGIDPKAARFVAFIGIGRSR